MLTATLLPVAAITGLGKTVLIIVAGTFILWSLATALSMPKRNPRFPENMGVYLTITAVLFIGQMAAVVWVTGTQEVEEETTAHEATSGGEAAPSGGEAAAPADSEAPAETEAPAESAAGDAAAGKTIFASAGCVACHTLKDAGANGSVGPNLDNAKPPVDLVVDRVTNGKGGMPSFKGQLEEQQIADVAAYVVSVAGK